MSDLPLTDRPNQRMSSQRMLCLVFTQPKPGQDSEYQSWYDSRHLHDVAGIPGVASAQRYDPADTETTGANPPARYLAIYEVEGDPDGFVKELRARFGTDAMPASPALDLASLSMTFWKPHGEGLPQNV